MPKNVAWKREFVEPMLPFIISKISSKKILVCGSFRRRADMVHDLDFVIIPQNLNLFFEEVKTLSLEVLVSGPKTTRVLFKDWTSDSNIPLQVDFLIAENEEEFLSSILHYTGSKWFNIKCRSEAKKRKWKLNQYGLFDEKNKKIAYSEEGILRRIGMDKFISPDMRTF